MSDLNISKDQRKKHRPYYKYDLSHSLEMCVQFVKRPAYLAGISPPFVFCVCVQAAKELVILADFSFLDYFFRDKYQVLLS